MKKLMIPLLGLCLNVSAMNQLIPSEETAKIFAVGVAAPLGYALAQNVAQAVYSPEFYEHGLVNNRINSYRTSEPDNFAKKMCRRATTPVQQAMLWTFHPDNLCIFLAAATITTAAARAPLGELPVVELSDMVFPMAVSIGSTAITSIFAGLRARFSFQQKIPSDEQVEAYKKDAELPLAMNRERVYRHIAITYANKLAYFVGSGAMVGLAGYLLRTRNK